MGGNFRGKFLPPIFPPKLSEIESAQKMLAEEKFMEGRNYSQHSSQL